MHILFERYNFINTMTISILEEKNPDSFNIIA